MSSYKSPERRVRIPAANVGDWTLSRDENAANVNGEAAVKSTLQVIVSAVETADDSSFKDSGKILRCHVLTAVQASPYLSCNYGYEEVLEPLLDFAKRKPQLWKKAGWVMADALTIFSNQFGGSFADPKVFADSPTTYPFTVHLHAYIQQRIQPPEPLELQRRDIGRMIKALGGGGGVTGGTGKVVVSELAFGLI